MKPKNVVPLGLLKVWIDAVKPADVAEMIRIVNNDYLDLAPYNVQLVKLEGGWTIGLRSLALPWVYCDCWVTPFNQWDWRKSERHEKSWEEFVFRHNMWGVNCLTKEYGLRLPAYIGRVVGRKKTRQVYLVLPAASMLSNKRDPIITVTKGAQMTRIHLFGKNAAPLGPHEVKDFMEGKLDERLR